MKSKHEELCALGEIQAAFPQDPRHRQVTLGMVAAIRELSAEVERLQTDLLGVKEYREKNPLGGPAKVFDAMADQIRAGDDYRAVMLDYGFCTIESAQADPEWIKAGDGTLHGAIDHWHARAERAEAELASLQERLKDAEKDAERYRFVAENRRVNGDEFGIYKAYRNGTTFYGDKESADAAIDSARDK